MGNFNGDINGDGILDHVDLALLKQVVQAFKTMGADSPFIQGLTPDQLLMLDVTQDGQINYDDVVVLCQKLIHQPQMSEQGAAGDAIDRLTALRNRLNHS